MNEMKLVESIPFLRTDKEISHIRTTAKTGNTSNADLTSVISLVIAD